MESVCATTVAVVKQEILIALGIHHKPYCYAWRVRLYNIFPRYPINGTTSEKR